jgi:hypothetical protein
VSDIATWLERIGAGDYVARFAAEEIDFAALPHLTESDLKELGLPIGPRRKVLAAIASLPRGPGGSSQRANNALLTDYTPAHLAERIRTSRGVAKQIEQGAPADIFASADIEWMTYLTLRKAINGSTRVNLLGNKLVLIAPKESEISNVNIGEGFDVAKLAGDGRIATGDIFDHNGTAFPQSGSNIKRTPSQYTVVGVSASLHTSVSRPERKCSKPSPLRKICPWRGQAHQIDERFSGRNLAECIL